MFLEYFSFLGAVGRQSTTYLCWMAVERSDWPRFHFWEVAKPGSDLGQQATSLRRVLYVGNRGRFKDSIHICMHCMLHIVIKGFSDCLGWSGLGGPSATARLSQATTGTWSLSGISPDCYFFLLPWIS